LHIRCGKTRKQQKLALSLDRLDAIFVGWAIACWVPPEVTLLEVSVTSFFALLSASIAALYSSLITAYSWLPLLFFSQLLVLLPQL